jgi:hypothetical protein
MDQSENKENEIDERDEDDERNEGDFVRKETTVDALLSSPLKRRNGSKVNDFFKKNGSFNECQVVLCSAKFKVTTSTTVLLKHIETKHPEKILNGGNSEDENDNNVKQSKMTQPSTSSARSKFQKKIDGLLIDSIVDENRPIACVDRPKFKKFVYSLNPNYIMPCRQTVSVKMRDKFGLSKINVIEFIKKAPGKLNLTTDLYTSALNKPFMSVTIHFIIEWKLVSFMLDIFYLPHPHDNVNINSGLDRVSLIRFFLLNYIVVGNKNDN